MPRLLNDMAKLTPPLDVIYENINRTIKAGEFKRLERFY